VSNGAHPSDYAARELWTAIPCARTALGCRSAHDPVGKCGMRRAPGVLFGVFEFGAEIDAFMRKH
jgi:hypothetical protein